MTLQNRVDPWGKLHAVDARGTLMGNRGQLHDSQRRIVRSSARTAWVTCTLAFNGRHREVFGPGTYSELFFLDEATALAAGHRPCATCQRQRYDAFKSAWLKTNGARLTQESPPMADIDKLLAAERTDHQGRKASFDARLGQLPDGTMIEMQGAAWLLWQGKLRRWTFHGYTDTVEALLVQAPVRVLTPSSVVQAIDAGFAPQAHASAHSSSVG